MGVLGKQYTVIYSVTDGVTSKVTKQNYKKSFRRFLDHFQMDDLELLTQAKENPRHTESMIIDYIKSLMENRNLSHGSIRTYCFAIFHFFEMNDILLNKRKVMRFLPADEGAREDRGYTHEEIHEILSFCDQRERAMVLFMASTGMRIGAITTLQLADLSRREGYNLYRITVYASSRKDRYYTFCTPECAQALDSYLDYRSRFGETLEPTSPLIREQFDVRDSFQCKRAKHMSNDGTLRIIKQLLKRSGLRSKNVKQNHGFRKFAITQMIKAQMDYDSREYLVGHRHSRGLGVNYDRTTEEDRLQEYLKAVNHLTINEENRLRKQVAEKEYTIKVELEELRKQIAMIQNVTQKDQAQVRKVRASPKFREKLMKS